MSSFQHMQAKQILKEPKPANLAPLGWRFLSLHELTRTRYLPAIVIAFQWGWIKIQVPKG